MKASEYILSIKAFLSIDAIDKELANNYRIPRTTLTQFVQGKRNFPECHEHKLEFFLVEILGIKLSSIESEKFFFEGKAEFWEGFREEN